MLARVHDLKRYSRHKLIFLRARSAKKHIEPVDPLVLDGEIHADVHVRPGVAGCKRHVGLAYRDTLAAWILENDLDRASSPRLVGFQRDDHPKVVFLHQEGRHLLRRLYASRRLDQAVNDPDDAHDPICLDEHSLAERRYRDVGTRIRHAASTLLRNADEKGASTMGQRYTTSVSFGSSQAPSPPVLASRESPGKHEFEQFETLTRKLVGVPKTELDKKRRAT